MFASIASAAFDSAADNQPAPVAVEVAVTSGLPSFNVIGAGEQACREVRDRIRCAFFSKGFQWPSRRITVELTSDAAVEPVLSSAHDLPIALAILAGSGQVDADLLAKFGAIGQLGLSGGVRQVRGPVALGSCIPADLVAIVPADDAEKIAPVRDGAECWASDLAGVVEAVRDIGNAKRAQPAPDAAEQAKECILAALAELRADIEGLDWDDDGAQEARDELLLAFYQNYV